MNETSILTVYEWVDLKVLKPKWPVAGSHLRLTDSAVASAGKSPIVTEEFFPSLLDTNSGEVPQLRHDRFLPNPFQFIIHDHILPFDTT
jgi:hypothetical protein